jgi:hypothetical protein
VQGFLGCKISDLTRQLELLFSDGILGKDEAIFSTESLGDIFDFGCRASEYHVAKQGDPCDFDRASFFLHECPSAS